MFALFAFFTPHLVTGWLLYSRLPWWKVTFSSLHVLIAACFLGVIPFVYGLSYHFKPAGQVLRWLGWAIFMVGAVLAGVTQNLSLGFYGIFYLLTWIVFDRWIQSDQNKSYTDPKTPWYQGVPALIPSLGCQIKIRSDFYRFRLRRLDTQGAFLFLDPPVTMDPFKQIRNRKVDLRIEHRGAEIQCQGRWVCYFSPFKAMGVKFINLQPDVKKELGDLVAVLEGEGHGI